MAQRLEEAYAAISRLTDEDQEAIGALILEEIASDERWQKSLALRPDVLRELAEKALAEHRAGATKPLVPDQL